MVTNSGPGSLRAGRIAVLLLMTLVAPIVLRAADHSSQQFSSKSMTVEWQTAARWRRRIGSTPGTIVIKPDVIRFEPKRGNPLAWKYEEIQSFYVSARHLVITGYANRGWHFPGVRNFRFGFDQAMPPAIAAWLAERVGKPSRNADVGHGAAVATLGAHHRARWSGTNGILQFRDVGIDYVTGSPGDGRSWRWADIQTVANPDPYHFRVAGFQEIYDFDLKQPMPRRLFDEIWDRIYARRLQLAVGNGGDHP